MKILSLTIYSAVFAWCQTPASVNAPLKNAANQYNGRLWKSLDENAKGAFLMGYVNATDVVAIIATKGSQSSKFSSFFWPSSLTGIEIRDALDKYYTAPEKAAVPITEALMDIARLSERLNAETVQKLLSDPCGTSSKQ